MGGRSTVPMTWIKIGDKATLCLASQVTDFRVPLLAENTPRLDGHGQKNDDPQPRAGPRPPE